MEPEGHDLQHPIESSALVTITRWVYAFPPRAHHSLVDSFIIKPIFELFDDVFLRKVIYVQGMIAIQYRLICVCLHADSVRHCACMG